MTNKLYTTVVCTEPHCLHQKSHLLLDPLDQRKWDFRLVWAVVVTFARHINIIIYTALSGHALCCHKFKSKESNASAKDIRCFGSTRVIPLINVSNRLCSGRFRAFEHS